MKEPELPESRANEPEAAKPDAAGEMVGSDALPKRRRSRWLSLIRLSVTACVISAGLLVAGFFLASSAWFEGYVRQRMVGALEDATGGRVEVASFHWNLLDLQAEASGITIHGNEAASEAPYAHVDRLGVLVGFPGLFHDLLTGGASRRVILREAEVEGARFHLIVYPDGSTNQPHPRRAPKPGKPAMDTLFDAQVGRLLVSRGSADVDNHVVPLELQAHDARLLLNWVPGSGDGRGSYRVQLGISEFAFAQGKFDPVPGSLEASVRLFHDGVQLESLRLAVKDHAMTIRGSLANFSDPSWQAHAQGQFDVRLLAPIAKVPFAKEGIVNVDATVNGHGDQFTMAGGISSKAIHYQDTVVDAQTADFSARFHSDMHTLVVSDIRAHLAQGGEVDGEFRYDNWLDSTPPAAMQSTLRRERKSWPVPAGTVKAMVSGVTLDTVLVMLAQPPYRHLGLDAVISGPASADWTGLGNDLVIGGQLTMAPSARPVAGEAPVHGSTDAAYHVDLGSVEVRTMQVHLPRSSLLVEGLLGVSPATQPSEMKVDFASSDLSEFDAVLRTLSLKQSNRIGAAALPVELRGQAQFHGRLNSSWLTPHIDGRLTATDMGIEIPSSSSVANAPLSFVHWDSVDVNGLYSPASIVVRQGVLRRGAGSLTIAGHLDADDPAFTLKDTEPEFDGDSVMSVNATAHGVFLSDVLPLAGVSEPIQGSLDAHVEVQGQLKALTGSGNVDLAHLTGFGESIDRLKASGSVAGKQVTITSLLAQQGAGQGSGQITGNGSYDLGRKSFKVDARGSGIDLAGIHAVTNSGAGVTGKAALTVIGEGTLDDPRLQAHATFSSLEVGSEPVADLLVSATTRQHRVTYDLSSHQPAGEFTAHGETSLDREYTTEATLQFAKFDIGALLKLMKVTGITGQSDLEGSARISGPLAHVDRLSGEASLQQLAVVVEGVHLASKGAVHGILAGGVARLDPVEITGENTDLQVGGTLALTGKQQLDLVASGSVNMRLAESLDTDLNASGVTQFQVEAHGPVSNPQLQGKVEFQNAALSFQDFPNGLSQIKGTLEFSQNRLEVRSLTAMSGGGQLSVGGYIGLQRGLYADLSATGKSIRIRYPTGISSLADATLRLQGPQNNLLLSGNVMVTKFAINSDLDIAGFATQTASVQPVVSPDAPSNHLRLDVHLVSAPQLNFQNAYAKLAGDVDLRLRGTLASPSVLGRISLTEGSTSIGGTKYELQRGDIYFNNPVKIQPNIDLDATARVEDYDITIGLHGTTDKLNVSYRSEPPLPEADVLALLALGRTQDEQRVNQQQQQQAGDNPMTDALLGGALNATVSNRVQRLFGTGAIKVDPNFIGSIGNSTARVTVVEQIGKNLTFTYASNVNTTSQQLIQAEIAINRHVSLLVTQDESGIFSMVVKARRRFK